MNKFGRNMKDFKTKLSAVMFTDIVGYSKISGINFQFGLQVAKENLEICSKNIVDYNGILQKELGDGTLSYFDSSVEAVKCGIKIMNEVFAINKDRAEKWHLRIGIHIGEVYFVNGDLLGETVNVASRIENFADPDTILISQDVFKIVKRSIEISTLKLGKTELKNIEEKHTLYEILGEASKTRRFKPFNRRKIVVPSLFIIIFLLSLFVIFLTIPSKYFSFIKKQNPSEYKIDHNKENPKELYFYDINDNFLWSKKISESQNANITNRVIITDLENDGSSEVIMGVSIYSDTTNFSNLTCLDNEGNKLWDKEFSKKVGTYKSFYFARQIRCVDLNNDGKKEIIVTFMHKEYWPTFLVVLDNEGNYLYQVLNGGYLTTIAINDIDNDGVKDIFCSGLVNVPSDDINSILMYINGKRIFDNDGLWKKKVCFAPVQDSIQTVDGYFYPQKTIFSLLQYGKLFYETASKIQFFDNYLKATVHFSSKKSEHIYNYSFYLNYSFTEWEVVLSHNFDNYVFQFIDEHLISDENMKKYYNEKYIHPTKLRFMNFETMKVDILVTGLIQ